MFVKKGNSCFGFQLTELQERVKALEEKCKFRYEAGEKSPAYNQFDEKYNLVSWQHGLWEG